MTNKILNKLDINKNGTVIRIEDFMIVADFINTLITKVNDLSDELTVVKSELLQVRINDIHKEALIEYHEREITILNR